MDEALQYTERAVFLSDADALVIADLHVGRDATSAVELPLGEQRLLKKRLDRLLDRFCPERVIIAGDLLDAFDHIPHGVRETLITLLDQIRDCGARPTILRGNHDGMLETIDLDVAISNAVQVEDTLVCHGHERQTIPSTVDRVILGHEHPVIEIEGQRWPCILLGPTQDGTPQRIVLPAFNPLAPGTSIATHTDGESLSPLVGAIESYRPVVVGESVHKFPPLKTLQTHL